MRRLFIYAFTCFVLFLTSCTTRIVEPMSQPSGRILGLASVVQPKSASELMAGYIPEDRALATPEAMMLFDSQMAIIVKDQVKDTRTLKHVSDTNPKTSGTTSVIQTPIEFWSDLGAKAGVDLLLVSQIMDWHEREGGEMGVQKSAEVFIQFFLIDIKTRTILHRSVVHKKQESLSGNFFDLGTFLRRGGKWVTAQDLANEGITDMVKEFGL